MLRVNEINFNTIDEREWTALVHQSHCASFFQTYAWIKCWLAHFEHTLDKTLILAVYDGDRLIGIGPFSIKNHLIAFITLTEVEENHTLSDYGDIIALAGKEDLIWQAILARIIQLKSEHGYSIKFNYLRDSSSSHAILSGMDHYQLEPVDVAPRIALPLDWATYLSTLSSHSRHELKRKMRLGEAQGLRLLQATIDPSTTQAYIELTQRVNQQKQQFYSAAMLSFFIDLLHQPGIELYFLQHNTSIIASLVQFPYKDDILAYNSSYDLTFNHLSPGIVLFGLTIQQAIQDKKQGFDFLRGCEQYKYTLGAVDQTLFGVSHGFGSVS